MSWYNKNNNITDATDATDVMNRFDHKIITEKSDNIIRSKFNFLLPRLIEDLNYEKGKEPIEKKLWSYISQINSKQIRENLSDILDLHLEELDNYKYISKEIDDAELIINDALADWKDYKAFAESEGSLLTRDKVRKEEDTHLIPLKKRLANLKKIIMQTFNLSGNYSGTLLVRIGNLDKKIDDMKITRKYNEVPIARVTDSNQFFYGNTWYSKIKIAKKNNFPSFSSPEDLLDWMDEIDYGWMDCDYNKHDDYGDKFWDKYCLLLPDEVLKYKTGTCWDQTIFENYVFDNNLDQEFEHKMIFIQQYNISTHTFLIFKKDDKWYHFEHSFASAKGIHGPYDEVEDIVKAVYKKMEDFDGVEDLDYDWTVMNPKDFQEKLNCKEFMDLCDYDYEKTEETDKEEKDKEDIDKESKKKKYKNYNKLDTQLFKEYKGPFKR